MTRKRKKLIALLAAAAVILCALLILLYRSQNPKALLFKKYIKYEILHMAHRYQAEETEGLDGRFKMTLYIDGEKSGDEHFSDSHDMKRLYDTGDIVRLVNYPEGYQLDLPEGAALDVSLSESAVRAYGDGYDITLSLELCPYSELHEEMTEGLAALVPWYEYNDATEQYIGYYQSRFLLNDSWQENNGVAVTRTERFDANDHEAIMYSAVISGVPDDKFDAYTYVYVKTDGQHFLRVAAKYHDGDTRFTDGIEKYFEDFRLFEPIGSSRTTAIFSPVLPETWSDETRSVYNAIAEADSVTWGIFTEQIYGEGIDVTIPEFEGELDYTFGIVLSYIHSTQEFPTEFMRKNYENGRLVELTYQITDNNNSDLFAHSEFLDIYRGQGDGPIRAFASAAKEYGHPFLFRLCNEMNSDWTSYGGVNNMADPDIFISNWRTIYEIFEEEGVDNCIWIFNPNDRNCPPSRWNEAIRYYPGDGYVHMIGVTGYNNGTYYEKWAEEWREFDVIYDAIEQEYGAVFGAFPWIITEFASSSIGGDKAAWIDNMFATIGNYKNIKAAVWFSYADYDADGTPARPYWLDETPETLDAFRRGLALYK